VRIAVISDLHLGSGGPADLFGHDDAEFLGFLRFLESNFERVVLLGDIWESLTSPRWQDAARELDRARAAHDEIARRFERPIYRYVHGNHDIVAAARDVPEDIVLGADGVRILFTHGHQQDFVVRNVLWMSELGVWLGGWLRRFGLASIYSLARQLDDHKYKKAHDPASSPFQDWAIRAATDRAADVVVTGHTHVAARAEHGSRLFMNSGSCADGNISFLELDTKRGTFAVHDRY
jgi:predicted phosphodiesterase